MKKISVIVIIQITLISILAEASTLSLSYSTYLGGTGWDQAQGIAVDSEGNAYVTGWTTSSSTFPVLSGFQGTFGGLFDVTVTKFSTPGNSLLYSSFLGGVSWDISKGIAVDLSGNAYVTGWTGSPDFPTVNPYIGAWISTTDAFVTKISPSGSSLSYSTLLGGPDDGDGGESIAVDSPGNAYVTGFTYCTDFPTMNPYQGILSFDRDAFVTKLSPSGSTLSFSTYLSGSTSEIGHGITLDSSENVYVTGDTDSTDFPTQNPYRGALTGTVIDAFITKLSSSGSTLSYSTYLGGTGTDSGADIAVDSAGSAYGTGYTISSDFPTLNPYIGTFSGIDAYVTKLSPSGSTLSYSTYLGGSKYDEHGNGIVVDSAGQAYVSGDTWSTDFPIKSPFQNTLKGRIDAFLTKLSASGNNLQYSTYLGGNSDDYSRGVAQDSQGSVYIAGFTNSANFPTRNPYQSGYVGGSYDAYVTKIKMPVATIGVFRSSTANFYLRNQNKAGPADISFIYGDPGDKAVSGDWDGDDVITIATYRPTTRKFFLRNSNSSGSPDLSFIYGLSGDIPLSGDWDGDGDTMLEYIARLSGSRL